MLAYENGKPRYLYEKMQLAAKLREDELNKEKQYKWMQLKKSYKRIDQLELRAHQDKIDR